MAKKRCRHLFLSVEDSLQICMPYALSVCHACTSNTWWIFAYRIFPLEFFAFMFDLFLLYFSDVIWRAIAFSILSSALLVLPMEMYMCVTERCTHGRLKKNKKMNINRYVWYRIASTNEISLFRCFIDLMINRLLMCNGGVWNDDDDDDKFNDFSIFSYRFPF